MKFMKWKIWLITCGVCLVPIIFGVVLWERLPADIAIHFDIHGKPDNYAPKAFTVFGLPVLMVLLQSFCCVINDINSAKFGERKKFERVVKWIIPCLTIVLQAITLGYALEADIDIRKAVSAIIGVMLIVMGNYIPKLDYVKGHKKVDTDKARKINRFTGKLTVIMGLLFVVSIFLPPVASVICLFMLVLYAAVCVIYGIKEAK